MGLKFRGQASKFKKGPSPNPAGFQAKSDVGPRQGVGGVENDAPGSYASASKRFATNQSTVVKSSPITEKSKTSPLKINQALVSGADKTTKEFQNYGDAVAEGFKEQNAGKGPAEAKAADLGEEENDIDTNTTTDTL